MSTMSLPHEMKAVILDMDGTLLDTEAVFLAGVRQVVEELGYAVSEELCHSLIGVPGSQGDKHVRAYFGPAFPFADYRC
jgi:beta-phosphoglucomutase-like phosphatase (HAD superfamily)